MLRRHTRQEYLESVRMLRDARPDMTFGTDLIVGFPGETEEDFQQTLSLMRQVRFAGVFAFKYSRRPGTAALALDGEPSDDVKSDRLGRLFELADDLLAEHFAMLVGSVQQVLVEEEGPRRDGRLSGRTERNEIVHIADGDARVGEIVQVRIQRAFRHSLEGTILGAGDGSRARARRLPIVVTEP
jgi:tRNA-2-methylthio-N6-dimethylallyladenosine synthase